MKKLIAVLCLLALCLPLVSCSSLETKEETETQETKETKGNQTLTQEEKETGPIVYPDAFSAGFGRACVTPTQFPIQVAKDPVRYAYHVKSDLYVTCVAVCDGENAALFFSLDMKFVTESFDKQGKKLIEETFGIPAENVFFNATHSHSSPTGDSPEITQWTKQVFQAVEDTADSALRDLAPAEIYTGRGDTTGLAFVRRYLMSDGTYKGLHSANPAVEYVAHESEADPELRTIRFERGEEKDILLANWQCHVASDANAKIGGKDVISADFVHNVREGVEKDLDVHFAYFNGASGNINIHSQIEGEAICNSTDEVGEALVPVVKSAVQNETKVESGPVKTAKSYVTATVRKDSSDSSYYRFGSMSAYEQERTAERGALPDTQEIPLYAISFGDIAFAGAPYEMCDRNGIQIREGANYNTTFSCGYTGGSMQYMPSEDMFPHGEYEVYSCRYVSGTGEACANELVRMLNEMK